MILINDIYQFIEIAKQQISEINRIELFADDSQLVKITRDYTTTDNILLAAIIPSHDTIGIDIDNVQYADHLAFILLAKRKDKTTTKDVVDNIAFVQTVVKQFVLFLLESASNDNCHIFTNLDVNSISIDPIWDMAQMDGYSIELKTKTNI